jgi:hypothetical protein
MKQPVSHQREGSRIRIRLRPNEVVNCDSGPTPVDLAIHRATLATIGRSCRILLARSGRSIEQPWVEVSHCLYDTLLEPNEYGANSVKWFNSNRNRRPDGAGIHPIPKSEDRSTDFRLALNEAPDQRRPSSILRQKRIMNSDEATRDSRTSFRTDDPVPSDNDAQIGRRVLDYSVSFSLTFYFVQGQPMLSAETLKRLTHTPAVPVVTQSYHPSN